LGPVAPARLDRPAERSPFELHPDASFERIEMLVEAVVRYEPQLGLNAMEQPVKYHLLPYIGIVLREHVQGKAEPPKPAPYDRTVRETRKAGWRPLRFRLARRARSSRLVNNHHRTTERRTPQPARVSLAELRGFLEIALGELGLDLRLGSRRSAEQHEQEEPVEMVWSLHRHLPSPKPAANFGAGGGNRTRTPVSRPRILSPVRLPVPPPRRAAQCAARGDCTGCAILATLTQANGERPSHVQVFMAGLRPDLSLSLSLLPRRPPAPLGA